MKNLMRSLIRFVVIAFVFAAVPAFAQTATTQTTFSAAVSATATTVNLTSGTGVAVGSQIFADAESMTVTGGTTTAPTVLRGAPATIAQAHAANAVVWVATQAQANTVFRQFDKSGTCTATSELLLPQINILNGNVQSCNPQGFWQGTDLAQANNYSTWPVTSITNVSYTALLTDVLIVYENFITSGAMRTVTLPAANAVPGHTVVVKDATGSSINGLATIRVIPPSGLIDGGGSVTLTTNFQSQKFFSDGVAWWRW